MKNGDLYNIINFYNARDFLNGLWVIVFALGRHVNLMLKQWSKTISSETEIDYEVILYGMKVFLNNLMGFLAITITASLAGCLSNTLAAYITAASIHIFSGGIHAKNPIICYISGTLIFVGIGLISPFLRLINEHNLLAVLFVSVVSLVIFILFAPVDTPNKPIKTMDREKLRRLTLITWGFWTGLLIIVATKIIPISSSLITSSTLGMLATSLKLIIKNKGGEYE